MSRKSERLVSLTIALLATKRFLTKSEIFTAIEGYEGETDAKERMFERDKEDLRDLGIDIEVGTFDPLFEDEAGYRIRSERYRLDIDELTPLQLGLLSLATVAWRNSSLDSTALSALVKLKALGVQSDIDNLPQISPRATAFDPNVQRAIDAISDRQTVSFLYLHSDLNQKNRVIEPYGAGTKNGFWYVAGKDVDKSEVRVFRIDRIQGDITLQGKAHSFQVPDTFKMQSLLASKLKTEKAVLEIRRNKAHGLLNRAVKIDEGDDWSRVEINYGEIDELVRDVLWHLDDVKIIEPRIAVDRVVQALESLVELHG